MHGVDLQAVFDSTTPGLWYDVTIGLMAKGDLSQKVQRFKLIKKDKLNNFCYSFLLEDENRQSICHWLKPEYAEGIKVLDIRLVRATQPA